MISFDYLEQATERAAADLDVLMKQLTTNPVPVDLARLEQIVTAGTIIWAARDEDRIVGTVSLVIMCQPRGDKAWLEDVVVDEAYRGQGIASHLMQLAIERAWRQGCRSVNLCSKPERQAVWKMYRGLGFVERETKVFRLVRPSA